MPDLAVMTGIYLFFLRKRWNGPDRTRYFLFYLVLCLVFLATLSPFIVDIPHLFGGIYNKYSFNPFVDLVNGYGSPLQECIENILLFIPLTFALRLAYHTSFWKALGIGMLCSLLIEFTQPLISSVRVCDITDFITNSCGALIGCLCYSVSAYCRKQPE